MSTTSDSAIEWARVREVAAIFHSRGELDAAVDALLLAGFDRADIDILADLDEVQKVLGPVHVAAEELADIGRVPRRPFLAPEDISGSTAVVMGVFGAFGAGAAAYAVVSSGGGTMAALAAALVAAAITGGIAALLNIRRLVGRDRAKSLEAHMEARGLVLWVRVRSAEREDEAREVLCARGGRAIRVHEVTIEKRPEEVPLSSLRPDPWLGNERLGQPSVNRRAP
jgi:hypothetical protein